MKCLDKKRIKMKGGETLALNERIMLSLVSTGVSSNWISQFANKNAFLMYKVTTGDYFEKFQPKRLCIDLAL